MTDKKHWHGLSMLDALRPNSNQAVDFCLAGTYSADLVVVVAILLALAGLENDKGSGSKVDFAQTVDLLRGKVRILAQAGRITLPRKTPKVMSLLDQFIHDVNCDEAIYSWHPKVALVRYVGSDLDGDTDIEWRLWISSRNFTRDMSWDAGLLLVGVENESGDKIPGVHALAKELFSRAKLVDVSSAEKLKLLKNVTWQTPKGLQIDSIDLLLPKDTKRRLPVPPADIKRLLVISPFLDQETVKTLGSWGDSSTERTLLSTSEGFSGLGKDIRKVLEGFKDELYILGASESSYSLLDMPIENSDDTHHGEDELLEGQGLHAKLIYVEHATGQDLWLGSVNATNRGWTRNYELITKSTVTGDHIIAGLESMVDLGQPVPLTSLDDFACEVTESDELDLARKLVSAQWEVKQDGDISSRRLVANKPPHPENDSITLSICLLGQDSYTDWPRGVLEVSLSPIELADETELIQVRLELGGSDVTWLQRAPLESPPGEERDRHALARHLDAKSFLIWIRSLLNQQGFFDGGGDCWQMQKRSKDSKNSSFEAWAPTLEEALKAWSRDPASLKLVDRKVQHYLGALQEMEGQPQQEHEKKILNEFSQAWDVIRAELIG